MHYHCYQLIRPWEWTESAHIARIATFLPNWKAAASLLGLENQVIIDIEREYTVPEERRSEALTRWVAKTGSQATYQRIYDALCELKEMQAAEMVKDLAGLSHGVLSLTCTHTHTGYYRNNDRNFGSGYETQSAWSIDAYISA